MKPTTVEAPGFHGEAIYRGWVDPGASAPVGPIPIEMDNDSGEDIEEGDLVVVIGIEDRIERASSTSETRPLGIAVDDIDDGDSGMVQFFGPVDLIHVTAAVSAGDFGQPSSTAGFAESSAIRGSTSFVLFTTSGTSPEGFLFGGFGGVGDTGLPTGGEGLSVDGMVPYYIPTDETFTVPLYKQGLWSEPIEVDGALIVNGMLLGVD